jgi:2-haloacid dehalogenase
VTAASFRDAPRRPDTGEPITTVVFDLGAVLIDWDPRHVYRPLFLDDAAMEEFLATICTPQWNAQQDRGHSMAAATAALVAEHPEHTNLITAYYGRWHEMLGEPIEGTVAIAAELAASGVRLLALSNWSAETFPLALPKLPILSRFDGIVISGSVGLVKPEPAIYELLIERHAVDVANAMFIDDSAANVAAASQLGFDAVVFTSPEQLRAELTSRGLLAPIDSTSARSVDEDE